LECFTFWILVKRKNVFFKLFHAVFFFFFEIKLCFFVRFYFYELILEAMKQDPELAKQMIDLGGIQALNCVIENHPLNEELTALASKALAE
jgi:hypothetical protein